MYRELSLAAILVAAAGCSSQRETRVNEDQPNVYAADENADGSFVGRAGPAGPIGSWSSCREFWYDDGKAELHAGDADRIAEIAAFHKQNPSLQIGIDSSQPSTGSDLRDPDLARRRAVAPHDDLVAAGVPDSSIKYGTYGDARYRRDRRVALVIRTGS